jgi:hypothetical protein
MNELRQAADRIEELTEALQDMVVAFGGGGVTESQSVRIQALNRACQILKVEPKSLAEPEYVTEVVAMHENGIYTTKRTPIQKRKWVGLTDEQIFEHEWWDEQTAFAVDKELKEKNNG